MGWLTIAAVAGLILAGCASIEKTEASFLGMIYDKDREPVIGAKVTVLGPHNRQFTGETDIYGRFSFNSIPFGQLRVTISRDQYEPFSLEFLFTTESQVFYAQISSLDQLTEAATKAFENREWDRAQRLIDKVLAIEPTNIEATYVQAFLLIKAKQVDKAIAMLQSLIDRMGRPYPVYLALADIYQYTVKNEAKAIEFLTKALGYRYDPPVEARLRQLKKSGLSTDRSPPLGDFVPDQSWL